jgi:[acyl-carrier-protein] S-malonyltransferase
MGRDLARESGLARDLFATADRVLGYALSRICFEGPEPELTLTANAQPAILTVGVACARILMERGVRPAAVAGHSLGEYAALVAAGALSFEDAVGLVHKRGRYMQEAVPVGEGAMAALLGIELPDAEAACREAASEGRVVEVANDNAPGQVVIAGHEDAVERALDRARARGARRAVKLPVSAPFHCALMRPAQERLAADLAATPFADPAVPVVTNVDAAVITRGAEARAALVRQVTSRVRWTESVLRLAEMGIAAAIETGPGQVLTGLVRRIAPALKVVATGDPAGLAAAAAAGAREA